MWEIAELFEVLDPGVLWVRRFFYASGYQISMWEIAVLFQVFFGWLMLILCISLSAMSVGASSKNSAFCLVA